MTVRFLGELPPAARRYDVAIVGTGVVGLSTALFLNRMGLKPLLIERLPTPASLTSRRSGEGVRAQWELPHNIAISRASIGFYHRFGEELGRGHDAGYIPCGYLYASRTEAGAAALAGRVQRQHAAGLDDVVYLDADAARRRFPLLTADVEGAAFRPGDGTVDVGRIIAGYLDAVDADLLLGTEVAGFAETGDGVTVTLADGETIACGALVLCNGARLAVTNTQQGWGLPIQTARSTILRVQTPAMPAFHPATVDTDIGSFWRPDTGGARLTASFRGLLFVPDGTDDPTPDPDYLPHAIDTVAPMFPHWRKVAPTITDIHMRTGSFAVTGDGAPVIGRAPGSRNVYINGGYGGHGVMMSPEGARWLAASVAGEATDNPFDPARFLGPVQPQPEPMTIHLSNTEKDNG